MIWWWCYSEFELNNYLQQTSFIKCILFLSDFYLIYSFVNQLIFFLSTCGSFKSCQIDMFSIVIAYVTNTQNTWWHHMTYEKHVFSQISEQGINILSTCYQIIKEPISQKKLVQNNVFIHTRNSCITIMYLSCFTSGRQVP